MSSADSTFKTYGIKKFMYEWFQESDRLRRPVTNYDSYTKILRDKQKDNITVAQRWNRFLQKIDKST